MWGLSTLSVLLIILTGRLPLGLLVYLGFSKIKYKIFKFSSCITGEKSLNS